MSAASTTMNGSQQNTETVPESPAQRQARRQQERQRQRALRQESEDEEEEEADEEEEGVVALAPAYLKKQWMGGTVIDMAQAHSAYCVQCEPGMTFYCVLCKSGPFSTLDHFEPKKVKSGDCPYDICLRLAWCCVVRYNEEMQKYQRGELATKPVCRIMTTTAFLALQQAHPEYNWNAVRSQPAKWMPDKPLIIHGKMPHLQRDIDGKIVKKSKAASVFDMFDQLSGTAKLDLSAYYLEHPEAFEENLTADIFHYSQRKFQLRQTAKKRAEREQAAEKKALEDENADLKMLVTSLQKERSRLRHAAIGLVEGSATVLKAMLPLERENDFSTDIVTGVKTHGRMFPHDDPDMVAMGIAATKVTTVLKSYRRNNVDGDEPSIPTVPDIQMLSSQKKAARS